MLPRLGLRDKEEMECHGAVWQLEPGWRPGRNWGVRKEYCPSSLLGLPVSCWCLPLAAPQLKLEGRGAQGGRSWRTASHIAAGWREDPGRARG